MSRSLPKILFIFSCLILAVSFATVVFGWTSPSSAPGAGGGVLYYSGGNVGIGTTTPQYILDVNGNARVTSALKFGLGNSSYISGDSVNSWMGFNPGGTGGYATQYQFFDSGNNVVLQIGKQGNPTALMSGNVGVGTASPGVKLDVLGGYVRSDTGLCVNSACLFSSGSKLYYNSGNFGVGTSNPSQPLEVSGNTSSTQFCLNGSCIASWPTGFAGGSTGQVQFNNAGTLGGDANLFWNNTNKYLGVGTSTPGALLDVQGAAQFGTGNVNLITSAGKIAGLSSTYFNTDTSANLASIITDETGSGSLVFSSSPTFSGTINFPGSGVWNSSGNVGVGMSPVYKLDVSGDINVGATNYYRRGGTAGVNSLTCSAGTTPSGLTISGGIVTSAGSCTSLGAGTVTYTSGTTNYLTKWGTVPSITNSQIYDNGTYVGIGTASPGYTLDVNGSTRTATEFISTLGGGSGQFRAISGNYGAFIRNDGVNTYMPLLTNSGNQYGSWNTLRPLMISNSTGDLYFANSLDYINQSNGYVGIGTTAPDNKLSVSGGNISVWSGDVWLGSPQAGGPARWASTGRFGGMYTTISGSGCQPAVTNPWTGGYSCPAGFTDVQLTSFEPVDSNCSRLYYHYCYQ